MSGFEYHAGVVKLTKPGKAGHISFGFHSSQEIDLLRVSARGVAGVGDGVSLDITPVIENPLITSMPAVK